jgi:putative SOS response-associated peptidase YedK
MCSRYRLTSPPDAVRALLATTNDEVFPPRTNIAPTQPVHVARIDERGQRRLDLVRWGLIPSWAKDPRELALLFVARSETALEKPTYRAGMRYRRCLVPADGYYEWTGPKGTRQPHLVLPPHPGPLVFAGIWDHWLGADGSEMESMTILTVGAGPDVEALSERMPAILHPQQFDAWLDCRGCPATEAATFLQPAAPGLLRWMAVTRTLDDQIETSENPAGKPSEAPHRRQN